MFNNIAAIDELLAAALRRESTADHHLFTATGTEAAIVEQILYHGVAGPLREAAPGMAGWPKVISKRVSAEAVAQTMWELRHQQILNKLLAELARAKVVALLLKGTALAYDLYPIPATRARGDSDLLVDPADLSETRCILEQLGFERTGRMGEYSDPFSLQEVWSLTSDRAMIHHIDLHWQTFNCPALENVLPVAECAASRVPLPRLGPHAMAIDRVRVLMHTCIHRMINFTSPYFVGDRTYYGGNRLIWLYDIDLLARAMSNAEWDMFVRLAIEKGVASACLDGLLTTRSILATPLPIAVHHSLGAASTASGPAAYLRARQLGRAWLDLRAMPGVKQKFGYALARILPPAELVRDKYPRHSRLPLALLYARRLFDLFRARPTQRRER